MKAVRLPILEVLALCVISQASSAFAADAAQPTNQAVAAGRALIGRIVPGHAAQFICEAIPGEDGRDTYEIESRDGKIVLSGNTGVAIAAALNQYLKEFCQADISYGCGDQLQLPATLPTVPRTVRAVSPSRYRYAYNYCTHGYTMAWWDWPQWEKELDFLALSGINLALLTEGQEQVWIDALKPFGYADAEVRQWLCLPSHQPWMYMSNIEGYGGPVPQSLIDRRMKLTQKIIARLRELGIAPMLPGYYGMVPPTLREKFPKARIVGTGNWCGAKRPDMLYPTDPLYPQIADAYHQAQARLYGRIPFLSGDPFHEGGVPAGVNLAECGKGIFASMQRAQPGVTWVLQAWGNNPHAAMLAGLDKARLLILDLNCEHHELWRARRAFDGVPYLWCVVVNFGGNNGLGGILENFANQYVAALRDPGHGALAGIGYMPEGVQTLPAIWALFLEDAWRTEPVAINAWANAYIRRRYGADDANARQAWATLLRLNYGRMSPDQEPFNSSMQARPSLNPNPKAREWATTGPSYPPEALLPAWKALIDAAPACGGSDGYRYDLADLGRQVLSDLGTRYHRQILALRRDGDKAAVRAASDRLLGLFDDVDAIVGTRREFLLGAWIRDARAWGATPAESDLCEHSARALLTIWSEPCAGSLRDYANRTWSGLVAHFYKPRWQMWLDALNADAPLNESAVREAIRKWEFDWVNQTTPAFSAEPTGDVVAISQRLYEKYRGDAGNPVLEAGTLLTDAKAADFVGRWQYPAEGATFERVLKADGTTQLYRNGKPLDWVGFTWKNAGNGQIEMRKADGTVFGRHALRDRKTLLFLGEPWGPATRVLE